MTVVSISELKAHLSRYIREVRRGGQVQIVERGRPVARLVAPEPGDRDADDARRRLVAEGVLRAGEGSMLALAEQPPLELPGGLSTALAEERADRL